VTEYRTLTVTFDKSERAKVDGVEVLTRPQVDIVLNGMAADGWRLDRFTVAGSFVFLVFAREPRRAD
jgi:hypothetical protein